MDLLHQGDYLLRRPLLKISIASKDKLMDPQLLIQTSRAREGFEEGLIPYITDAENTWILSKKECIVMADRRWISRLVISGAEEEFGLKPKVSCSNEFDFFFLLLFLFLFSYLRWVGFVYLINGSRILCEREIVQSWQATIDTKGNGGVWLRGIELQFVGCFFHN
ncbi:hypothetical protein AMTR_s00010p00261240 [Amborella trichopoda]|uniref:Uncharacterized protein n=1 Tax=Amborella trichopoda TaxID=13333 RepID=W1NH29_AMBTC|nr:hypothetical protein AMTR_s00010p00261240 [Amborella trichopoda]